MGFSETLLLAKSGDGGIDLRAKWEPTQVPGLRIDLDFAIPSSSTLARARIFTWFLGQRFPVRGPSQRSLRRFGLRTL